MLHTPNAPSFNPITRKFSNVTKKRHLFMDGEFHCVSLWLSGAAMAVSSAVTLAVENFSSLTTFCIGGG